MKEKCGTVMQALASIRSMDEMDGFTDVLRNHPGAKTVTNDEWAAIARRKIELQKGEKL